MTSRNLFFNLLKEDFKRRLWVFILAAVVFFGTFGVAFTMVLERWVESYSERNLSADSFSYGLTYDITDAGTKMTLAEKICWDIIEFIALNPWMVIVACVGAVICGVSGFAFLHSKKQVDFYHSLPVKRELIFAVRFVNGILFYVIPYVISLLYAYLICGLFGAMSWKVVLGGTAGLIVHLMGFTVIYLATILAVLLTGKLLISFFGIFVLNLYAPAIYALWSALKEIFFVTSYVRSIDIEDVFLKLKYASPISYYLNLYLNVYNAETMKVFWLELGAFLIFGAVLAVICIWLYKKRMSEKSETAMSFQVSEPIIRILIAVPVGVLVGFMFFLIQNDYNGHATAILWMVFGCIIGAVLVHGFIESLYRGDIKKCLSHKIQLAVTVAAAILIPLFFYYDVFGYDSYLPKKSQVKEMAMYNHDLRFAGSYYNEEGLYLSAQEYTLEKMSVKDFDAMYELAEILCAYTKEMRRDAMGGNLIYCVDDYEWSVAGDKGVYMTDFIFKYTLKDGSEVVRAYEFNYWAVLGLLEQIYNNPDYKMAASPAVAFLENEWTVGEIDCYSPLSSDSYRIRIGADEIARVYADEWMSMQFDDLTESAGIGRLEFIEKNGRYSTSVILYPSMTRTIALLKERGYTVPLLTECDNISKLYISYTVPAEEGKDKEVPYVITYGEATTEEYYYDGYQIQLTITDAQEIKACLPYLISRQYYSEFGPFPTVEGGCNVNVVFTYGEGDEKYEETKWFYFLEGQIPEFLKEKLGQ